MRKKENTFSPYREQAGGNNTFFHGLMLRLNLPTNLNANPEKSIDTILLRACVWVSLCLSEEKLFSDDSRNGKIIRIETTKAMQHKCDFNGECLPSESIRSERGEFVCGARRKIDESNPKSVHFSCMHLCNSIHWEHEWLNNNQHNHWILEKTINSISPLFNHIAR